MRRARTLSRVSPLTTHGLASFRHRPLMGLSDPQRAHGSCPERLPYAIHDGIHETHQQQDAADGKDDSPRPRQWLRVAMQSQPLNDVRERACDRCRDRDAAYDPPNQFQPFACLHDRRPR